MLPKYKNNINFKSWHIIKWLNNTYYQYKLRSIIQLVFNLNELEYNLTLKLSIVTNLFIFIYKT